MGIKVKNLNPVMTGFERLLFNTQNISLADTGEKSKAKVRHSIESKGLVISGRLLKSIKFKLFSQTKLKVWSAGAAGGVVEEGIAPGTIFPPVKKLKKWMKLKGISERAAFPIARKIFDKGTKPQPFGQDILFKIGNEFIKIYDKEFPKQKKKQGF